MVFVAALLIAVGKTFGILISNTDSAAPAGVYRVVSADFERGDLVAACLPIAIAQAGLVRGYLRTGPCAGNAEPVGKIAGALPGDVVEIESGWVAINGGASRTARRRRVTAMAARFRTSRGAAHRVAANQVWLFGFNDRRSWDARYFGPIPLANVTGQTQTGADVVKRSCRQTAMATATARSRDYASIISPTSADLIALAGLDLEPPDFLLGALLSVAQEARDAYCGAAGAGRDNRPQQTRRAGDRQARVEVVAARAGPPRTHAQQRAGARDHRGARRTGAGRVRPNWCSR